MNYSITAAIVGYRNDPVILKSAIDSFLNTSLNVRIFLIDNSPTDALRTVSDDPRFEYIYTGSNLGFGRGHNVILNDITNRSKYHVILNPDVSFEPGTLEKLYEFMERSQDVGLTIPKVIDENGEPQNSYKRLPAPIDLLLRRFGSVFTGLFKKRLQRYEMTDKDMSKPFDVPSVSGCFMFFRASALREIGFFDDRYFIYLEDVDISRRMIEKYRNVYFPDAIIVHLHARASYGLNKLLFVHMQSAIKYFNKWGWMIDRQRNAINQKT